MNINIKQLIAIEEQMDTLSEILIRVVEDGASIGFLPPLSITNAERYWGNAVGPEVILLIATINDQIVGSVQLHLCTKENGSHRAEIAKLMTHPNYRRRGIARLLMIEAEERAKQERKSILVLDTREGDPSNLLYTSLGYVQAGRIPNYAKSANGQLHATIYYYKNMDIHD